MIKIEVKDGKKLLQYWAIVCKRGVEPVVDEVVVVPGCFAIRSRLHPHAAFDKLVCLQRVEHGAKLFAVKLEQLQHVFLTHTWVPDQHIQGQSMVHSIEAPYDLLG